MKSIEQLANEFDRNEGVRASVRRSETMRKGQRKGNVTRNRNRAIDEAFKRDKIDQDKY